VSIEPVLERLRWLVEHLEPEPLSTFLESLELETHRFRFSKSPVAAARWCAFFRKWLVSARLHDSAHWQGNMVATEDFERLAGEGRSWSLDDVDTVLKL